MRLSARLTNQSLSFGRLSTEPGYEQRFAWSEASRANACSSSADGRAPGHSRRSGGSHSGEGSAEPRTMRVTGDRERARVFAV